MYGLQVWLLLDRIWFDTAVVACLLYCKRLINSAAGVLLSDKKRLMLPLYAHTVSN
jgi:hypothetical protein